MNKIKHLTRNQKTKRFDLRVRTQRERVLTEEFFSFLIRVDEREEIVILNGPSQDQYN